MAMSILSYLYCICNKYWQNHRSILPNFLLFAWFDTLEFNRLPCSNNKIYDDANFANRFRYQLAMFEMRVLIWLSWLLHAHIANITDGAKIIAAFCRISYCFAWFHTVEFNCRRCSNNKMHDDMVFNDRFWYQLTMFEVCIFTGLSRILDTHIAYEIAI